MSGRRRKKHNAPVRLDVEALTAQRLDQHKHGPCFNCAGLGKTPACLVCGFKEPARAR
jgi:hypothetical protein